MPLLRTTSLRIATAALLGALFSGCVAMPGDAYYGGGGGGGGGGGYYPGPTSVTVYEQPGVIYGAPPLGWRNYPPTPSGWREDAWRERHWREAREREARERRDMDRRRDEQRRDEQHRDAERYRDQQRREAERQRDAERREAERRRDMDRRAYEQRQHQHAPSDGGSDMRDLLQHQRRTPRPDWR